jgi:hypothetical protein
MYAAVTVMSDLQSRIDALAARMRPHAVSPVAVTRKATDTSPPAGVRAGYGRRNTLSGRKQGGRYPNTYRPRAADFANNPVPVTARSSAPNVARTNGIRVAGYTSLATARAMGDDNAQRQWSSARGNLKRDAGDATETGESYPRGISRTGKLAPSARY